MRHATAPVECSECGWEGQIDESSHWSADADGPIDFDCPNCGEHVFA